MKRRAFFKLAAAVPFVGAAAPQIHCPACDTALPAGARFCIECSAPQAVTGATGRLASNKGGLIDPDLSDGLTPAPGLLHGDSTWQPMGFVTVTINGKVHKLTTHS